MRRMEESEKIRRTRQEKYTEKEAGKKMVENLKI